MKQLVLAVLVLAAPVAAQEKPFDWKLKPEVGSKWRVETTTRVKQAEHLPGLAPAIGGFNATTGQYPISVTAISKASADYDILSRDVYGAYTVRLTFRGFSLSVEGIVNGERIPILQPVVKQTTKAFIGTSLLIKTSPTGKRGNIIGIENLLRKLNTSMPGGGYAVFDPQNSESNIISVLTPAGQLPSFPLLTGAAYSYSTFLPGEKHIDIPIYVTKTLQSRINGKATFTVAGQIESEGNATYNFSNLNVNSILKINGTLTGKTVVDEASGLPLESTQAARYKGLTTVTLPGGETPSTLPQWRLLTHRVVFEPRS